LSYSILSNGGKLLWGGGISTYLRIETPLIPKEMQLFLQHRKKGNRQKYPNLPIGGLATISPFYHLSVSIDDLTP
jgi:hypothetical protein